MEQTKTPRKTPLIPEQKTLRKALMRSSRDAHKLARAFGVKVATHRQTKSSI
jgi:hypothetical protein